MPATKKLSVFISHASQDQDVALELGQHLEADGFDPWLYEDRLLPGMERAYPPPILLARGIKNACLRGRFLAGRAGVAFRIWTSSA
jgi:hypothetical protein